jgi:hypothetical protein
VLAFAVGGLHGWHVLCASLQPTDLAGIFTVIGAKCNPVPWQKGQTFTI